MAIHGYPGNIISASSPLYTPGFASGIWNLGSWPRGVTVVQTFTASGYWTARAGVTAVDYLVVAGGGGGGGDIGGGGGAGDAAAIVQEALARDGVDLCSGVKIQRVVRRIAEKLLHVLDETGQERALACDAILVGAGRAPNVQGMNLESVGVAYDEKLGVRVDDFLRTSNKRIYAAGDVCMAWKFTHAADAAAKIVVQNALFSFGPLGKQRLSKLVMPWCTYTQPEVAHVGMYEHDARAAGLEIDTY